jgi:hypothetical protein
MLRIALFALGLKFFLDSSRPGGYPPPLFSGPYRDEGSLLGILGGIIVSGVGAGVLLLILGALVGPVIRHHGGWLVLALTLLGGFAPFVGVRLIFAPPGGDRMSTWGDAGFMLILLGIPLFFTAYVWDVLLGVIVIARERRDQHYRRTPAPHTGAP